MLHYGLMIGVGTLVFLNVVGTALNFAYTAVYIMVIKDKVRLDILVLIFNEVDHLAG